MPAVRPSLTTLLNRANEGLMAELLGVDVVRLLRAALQERCNSAKLREVLIELKTLDGLLRSAEARMRILEVMRPEELQALELEVFGNRRPGDPCARLGELRPNSGAFARLRSALEVPVVVPEEVPEPPDLVDVEPDYRLFDHQIAVVRQIEDRLSVSRARVVLHMPTGSGKTRTAMTVVANQLRALDSGLIVWLATSEELCDQAASEFERAWKSLGNRSARLWRAWGDHPFDRTVVDEAKFGVVIAGLAKLSSAAGADQTLLAYLGDKVRLVVFDEAHQSIAPTYHSVVETLLNRNGEARLLGLTATPGRTWNDPAADRRLSDFFGNSKVGLKIEGYPNPIEYLISQGFLARPNFRELRYQETSALSDADLRRLAASFDIPDFIARKLATNEVRNLAILREARDLLTRHSRVLLFGSTVQHAELLAALLSALGHQARCVSGNTAPGERTRVISWFKEADPEPRLLCNFGVLTTGFDAPQTSAALIARPTKSLVLYSQMVGRAIRGTRAGGNNEAEIVTVIDTDLPGFGDLASAFSNWEDVW